VSEQREQEELGNGEKEKRMQVLSQPAIKVFTHV
jgi:hypothetical protein